MDSIMAASGSSLPNVEGSIESLSSPLAALPLSCVPGHSIDSYHMVGTSEGQEKLISCNVNVQSESMPNDVDKQQSAIPSRESGQAQAMHHNLGQMNLKLPNKRKASTELSPDAEGARRIPFSNRRAAQASPVASATSASMSNSPRSTTSGKKVAPLESSLNKSQSTVTKRDALQQESPKSQAGSHESVRAKMRESLASALALVSKPQECCSDGKMVVENESAAVSQKRAGHSANVEPGNDEAACSFRYPSPSGERNDGRNGSQTKETCEEATQTSNSMESDFQPNPVSSGEDATFWNDLVSKDELVQANGLSWVSDSHIPEVKQVENTDKPILMHEDVSGHVKEQTVQTPELLALKIELELYKLFGGVNKKYKEKGRSLLFNLKDRNNPDLREKVVSGEIPPDRLCSMTAEELASKELSQWRIAKAEELDHMRVLPDSEVNMRRLVKKTHKGEYQVDLDPDIGAPEEIPLGTGVSNQNRSKINGVTASPTSSVDKNKEVRDSEIISPRDGADMQGRVVMDDVRDLPPIFSLDKFLDSHDKGPPVEKQPADCGRNTELAKETSELGSQSKSPVKPSEPPTEMTSQKTREVDLESIKSVGGVKSTYSKVDTFSAVHPPKGESVWEGEIELNLSSMAYFIALYKSGQKACTKEWPSYFEIKGRVKLDAFEKFVEALPMSRSRAIMVSHFVLSEAPTDFERANLTEVVDSYNVDQRLGFAEPIPGVELYLCPPRSRTVDIIINHLPRSYTEKLNDIDNGLIGIVVWRKVQIIPSSNSPNSRGQIAVNYNNRNVGSANRPAPLPPVLSKPEPNDDDDDDDDAPPGFGPPGPRDEDDLPEFSFSGGPNPPISRHSNPDSSGHGLASHRIPSRVPSGQVEQMRELVKKYGQNEIKPDTGIPVEPWNDDDDDDDIPEWHPQPHPQTPHHEPPPPPPATLPSHNPVLPPVPPPPQPLLPGHNPLMPPPVPDHNPVFPPHMPPLQHPVWPSFSRPLQPLQPPMRVNQQGNWWPYGGLNSVGTQPNSGQLQGTSNLAISPSEPSRDWKHNASNYRGL